MIQGNLVAGSDSGDDQNGRLVISVAFSSDDLLESHVSGHEVYGHPNDSGRVETIGLLVVILYLCCLRKWHDIPKTKTVTIFCDNEEAVKFSKNIWTGTMPKWVDSRNIEIKRTIKEAMVEAGQSLRIEHVHGHQDEKTPASEISLPARINIMCDRECARQLSKRPRVQAPEGKREMLQETQSCIAIDGSPVTGTIREALVKKVTGQK